MVLEGTLVNGATIIVGTLIGLCFRKIPDQMKDTVMKVLGLAVILLGIQMGLEGKDFLIVIFSLVIGSVLGEWWRLDLKLQSIGEWLQVKMKSEKETPVAEGFVTATLIFVIGAMAILGPLDSGIRQDHTVLYTKSMIDGFTSIILGSTLGIGVLFSFIPVVLYQGSIALLANVINQLVSEDLMALFIANLTATGGILIMAIGLSIMGLSQIRIANLLPSIIVVVLLTVGQSIWPF